MYDDNNSTTGPATKRRLSTSMASPSPGSKRARRGGSSSHRKLPPVHEEEIFLCYACGNKVDEDKWHADAHFKARHLLGKRCFLEHYYKYLVKSGPLAEAEAKICRDYARLVKSGMRGQHGNQIKKQIQDLEDKDDTKAQFAEFLDTEIYKAVP